MQAQKFGKKDSPSESPEAVNSDSKPTKAGRARYPDMQSAVRFPIKLPISVKSKSGDNLAETAEYFRQRRAVPGGFGNADRLAWWTSPFRCPRTSWEREADVQLDCRGRVVRNFEEDGRRGVGVVIDEYRFERR